MLTLCLLAPLFAQDAALEPSLQAQPESWDLRDVKGQVRPGDPYWELELLYHQSQYQEGLARTEELLAASPEDVELIWHKVRFMFEIAERLDRTDTGIDKEAWYAEMLAVADQGLALSPGHPHLLFGKGVALGRYGTTRGVLSSLSLATTIEDSWQQCSASDYSYRSIGGEEVLPCDCMHALGIFYRLVPDSWIVELIAGTRGSLEKSLEQHLLANACNPDDISNKKELAVTQLCLGNKNDDQEMIIAARANLLSLQTLTPNSPSAVTDQAHARLLLSDPSLACGYSRDGQQDVDDSKLEAPSQDTAP